MGRPLPGILAILVTLTACDASGGTSATCGLAALAGATTLLHEFGVPGQPLAEPPARLPGRLVARVAAGPAYSTVIGRVDSVLVVAVEGQLPADTRPGFGVLVLDREGRARGVMLYNGLPIEGARTIGQVHVGEAAIPLLGVEADPHRFEDPRCPFFPDSMLP